VRGCSSTIQQVHFEQFFVSRSPNHLQATPVEKPSTSLSASPTHRSALTSLGLSPPRLESIRSRQQLPLQAIYRFVVHGFSSYVSITRRDSQRSSSVRFPRVPSRTSVRRTRTQAASIPIKGGLFSFPSVRTDPLVLELFQFPRGGLPGSPSIPRLFVILGLPRATWGQHTSSGGLSGLFLDAQRPAQVTLGMDTQHQHPSLSRTFPSPISRLPFAFPSALFDHQDFVHTTTMWLGITTVRRQPATASSCLALRRCLRIRTTHTPCPPSIEHSELAG